MNTSGAQRMVSRPELPSQEGKDDWIAIPDGLVEELRVFPTFEELETYQADLMYKLNRPEWDGTSICRMGNNPLIERVYCSLAIYVCTKSVNELLISDVHYSTSPPEYHNTLQPEREYQGSALGFKRWLSIFAPKDWNDLLMVRDCYLEYVIWGREPNWNELSFQKNDQIASFLKSTRGLLRWGYQFDLLTREALSQVYDFVSHEDIDRVMFGYEEYLNGAKSKKVLLVESLRLAGTSFVEVLRERLAGVSPFRLGEPSFEVCRLANILWEWRLK